MYYQYENKWEYKILTRSDTSFELNPKTTDQSGKEYNLKTIVVTAVDRLGNESQQKIISVG